MKFRYFFPLFLILILVSCKDNEIIPENIPSTPESSVYDSDKLYLNINISNNDGLISAIGTRAEDMVNIDGESYADLKYIDLEKYVINGYIFIYEEAKNKEEADAVCVSKGELNNGTEEIKTGIVVKSLYYNNIELDMFDYDESKTYYALAILNAFEDDSNSKGIILPEIDQKFSEWATKPQPSLMTKSVSLLYSDYAGIGHHKKLITMANATGHAKHDSGDFNPTTLVKIEPEDIQRYPFREGNKANTDIYVQRNVAKVTISKDSEEPSLDKIVDINADVALQFNVAVLLLDVINTESYPVQKIDGLSWNRSFSHTNKEADQSVFDQIYWAIDPNYDDETKSKNTKDFTSSSYPPNNGVDAPLYCLENTFNTDCMIQGQTTRAIIRCKLNWWGSDDDKQKNSEIHFNNDYADYLNTENGNPPTKKSDVIGNDFDKNGFFTTGQYDNIKVWDLLHIRRALKAKSEELGMQDIDFDIDPKYKLDPTKQGTWDPSIGGYYKINDLLTSNSDLDDDKWSQLAPALGINDINTEKIAYYYNGWVNYVIRIRHFTDDEDDPGVKWDGTTTTKEDGTLIAQYTDSHLGRYGVLRNNWYDITINKINSLGSPEQFPEITDDDTDDMPEKLFMEVKIQVKNWNKRQVQFDL